MRRDDQHGGQWFCPKGGVRSYTYEKAHPSRSCCDECVGPERDTVESTSDRELQDSQPMTQRAGSTPDSQEEEEYELSQGAEAHSPRAVAKTEHLPVTQEGDLRKDIEALEDESEDDEAPESSEDEESETFTLDPECDCHCHWVEKVSIVEPTCEVYHYYDKVGDGWREDNEDCFGLLLMLTSEEEDDG
ncbi:hypothetical protein CSOJ01_14702, partial [Colletotrichum sojae]